MLLRYLLNKREESFATNEYERRYIKWSRSFFSSKLDKEWVAFMLTSDFILVGQYIPHGMSSFTLNPHPLSNSNKRILVLFSSPQRIEELRKQAPQMAEGEQRIVSLKDLFPKIPENVVLGINIGSKFSLDYSSEDLIKLKTFTK